MPKKIYKFNTKKKFTGGSSKPTKKKSTRRSKSANNAKKKPKRKKSTRRSKSVGSKPSSTGSLNRESGGGGGAARRSRTASQSNIEKTRNRALEEMEKMENIRRMQQVSRGRNGSFADYVNGPQTIFTPTSNTNNVFLNRDPSTNGRGAGSGGGGAARRSGSVVEYVGTPPAENINLSTTINLEDVEPPFNFKTIKDLVFNTDLYKENEKTHEVFNLLFEAIIEKKPLKLYEEPEIMLDEEGEKIIFNMFHFFILLNDNFHLNQQDLQFIKDAYLIKNNQLEHYFKKKIKEKEEEERQIKEEEERLEMEAAENRKEKEFRKVLDVNKHCKICLGKVMTHGLGHLNRDTDTLSCHYCVCEDCANQLQTTSSLCPVCREPIDFIIRVFDSSGESTA